MARQSERLSLPLADEVEPEVPLYTGDMRTDLEMVGHRGLADAITGGLSFTSKMPCPSWGISAARCRIGSVLAAREGSACHDCYARKGRYLFSSVQHKLEARYQGLSNILWTPSMVFLIRWHADRYFRFFDSGDVQNENHLRNIITIARHVPDVQFWLPTREAIVVKACQEAIPDNLVVRLSATMIDGKPPRGWPTTSTVVSDPAVANCPAPQQNNACGDCRRCWDATEKNIAYALH